MRRYATLADLPLYDPAFATADPVAQVYLDAMARLINLDAFLDRSLPAHVFLTLHSLAVAGLGTGGEAGPVTSRRVRDLATTYATTGMPSPSELATTKWGRLYLALERATPTIGIAVP